MSGHTPGPWRYQGELTRAHGLPDRMRYEIYTAAGKYGHPATCDREEDARLIAAAPDLLQAASEALNALRDYVPTLEQHALSMGYGRSVISALQTAIAKAEGK